MEYAKPVDPAFSVLPPTIAEMQLKVALRNSARTHIGRIGAPVSIPPILPTVPVTKR